MVTIHYSKAGLYSLLGFLIAGSIFQVDGHGVEVRHCLTTDGDLRIFVEHWHGDLSSTTEPGGIDIRNDINGTISTLNPTGVANNIDLDNGGSLPGCPVGVIPTIATTCPGQDVNDWVYYDFPFSCDTNISYTLLKGLTVYLEEACDGLYPANIRPYENCANAPSHSPSQIPSKQLPSVKPSRSPTQSPSMEPSMFPSSAPTCSKGKGSCPKSTKGSTTKAPSVKSSKVPAVKKTDAPNAEATKAPSVSKKSNHGRKLRAETGY